MRRQRHSDRETADWQVPCRRLNPARLFGHNGPMSNKPNDSDNCAPAAKAEPYDHPLYWLLLLAPPLAAPIVAVMGARLAVVGLPGIGGLILAVVFFLLTPLLCAVWALRICWRLTNSSIPLTVFLFAIELVLILVAFLLVIPRWD